jgi:hypothetical protein
VTVSDGDCGKRHTVHTSVIIRSSSEVLKAALLSSQDPRRAASGGRNIPVHGTEGSTLESYLHWLYTDCILNREPSKHYSELFALYLLGDYLQDTKFCEKVVQALIIDDEEGFVWPPQQADVSFVWARTLHTSPLRRVIKEIWLTMPMSMAVQSFKEAAPETPYPMDLILDLFAQLVQGCNGATNVSFSGKALGDLRDTCVGFVRDAAALEEGEIRG